MVKQLSARITGRVQLVMFRDFTCRNARRLGLVGWVKNEDDGSVSVVAVGEEEKLSAFIERLHKGPPLARVDNVSIEWTSSESPPSDFSSFDIVYK